MIIGYLQENPAQCYRIFNSNTGRATLTRDIIWLGWMYYQGLNTKVTQQLPIVAVPVTQYKTYDTDEAGVDFEIITGEAVRGGWLDHP